MVPDKDFKFKVYDIVARIPAGRVLTYGDIAALAGHPSAARIVGQVAHFGPEDLPWQRVVNRFGGLARGFWGGKEVHAQLLQQEGIEIENFVIVNFEHIRWREVVSGQ